MSASRGGVAPRKRVFVIEAVKVLADLYTANTVLVDRALQDISENQASLRPLNSGNSMQWILGHLTASRHTVCDYLGSPLQYPHGKLFARGSRVYETEMYPRLEELLRHWKEVSELLQEYLGKVTEEEFYEPIEKSFLGMEKTVRGAVSFLHLHESYHVGQLAYIRRLLGHSQMVG